MKHEMQWKVLQGMMNWNWNALKHAKMTMQSSEKKGKRNFLFSCEMSWNDCSSNEALFRRMGSSRMAPYFELRELMQFLLVFGPPCSHDNSDAHLVIVHRWWEWRKICTFIIMSEEKWQKSAFREWIRVMIQKQDWKWRIFLTSFFAGYYVMTSLNNQT